MRETIQSKLNELTSVESGNFRPDDVVELGTTYFGYELQDNYASTDLSRNDTRRISIIGFVVRKTKTTENTLEIIDATSEDIKEKLKELNFKLSSEDITLQNEIRKIKITGYVYLHNGNLVF